MIKAALLPEFGTQDPGPNYENYFNWIKERYNIEVEFEYEGKVKVHVEAYWKPGWNLYSLKLEGVWHKNIAITMAIRELNRYISREWEEENKLYEEFYAKRIQVPSRQ